jgi:hypothetical protein
MSDSFSLEDRAKAQVLNNLLLRKIIRRGDLLGTEFVFGSSGTRADIVIFSKTMIGVEVKSSADTLRRLPSQVESYYDYCNEVIFAVAPKHLAGLKMMGIPLSDTWSLLEDGSVREFDSRRLDGGRGNVEAILTQCQLQRLNKIAPQGDKKRPALALALLSERFVDSSRNFWSHIGRRKIRASDIRLLSRFRLERQELALNAQAQRKQWDDWNLAADRFFGTAG